MLQLERRPKPLNPHSPLSVSLIQLQAYCVSRGGGVGGGGSHRKNVATCHICDIIWLYPINVHNHVLRPILLKIAGSVYYIKNRPPLF